MGGASSRNKGAAGEREFNAMLAVVVTQACLEAGAAGIPITRNFAQSSSGGCDMDALAHLGLAFEVKRHETLQINTWWKQIVKASEALNAWPILAYRQNRQDWTFTIHCRMVQIDADGRIFMEREPFLAWLKKFLVKRLQDTTSPNMIQTTPPL